MLLFVGVWLGILMLGLGIASNVDISVVIVRMGKIIVYSVRMKNQEISIIIVNAK